MRYTVIMSGKTAFRIAGCKPIGWVFAFVLGVTQMYPAFGACICLREAQETAEVSISSEDTSSCRLAARQPVTREEMDCGSGHCSQDAGRTCAPPRISRDNCCGADSGWTPPLPASVSRTVEVRPVFDAMPWTRSEEAGKLSPRFDRLAWGTDAGIHVGFGAAIYLLNASLLI